MAALAVDIPPQTLQSFCEKWKIERLAVFGSALRNDFRPDSGLDVLVTFRSDAHWGLWDVIAAEEELSQLVGRRVDLVERSTVEQSENWIRRNSILSTARIIYGG